MNEIDRIETFFLNEFGPMADKFEIIRLRADEVSESDAEYVWHPGVYVWWNSEKGPIKVGRHLTNSRKRALEHIRDNTGGIMADMANDPSTVLLLFNVKDPGDRHWVASLEIFLEKTIEPLIESGRTG